MPRKVHRPLPPHVSTSGASAPRGFWPGLIVTAALFAALGSGVTYLALRPAQRANHAPAAQVSGIALRTEGNTAFDHKDWATAIADYNQAIAAGDDNPDIRTDLGTAYRSEHQPQQALDQYAIAQREDPGHENSLVNEGIVYAFDLNNMPQAVAIWHQYLVKFPQGSHVADVKRLMTLAQSRPNTRPAS